MASRAHEIRLVAKLQSGGIGTGVVTVRVMTSSAADLSFLKTLRAFEGFDHECGLAETAVLVKALAGKLAEGKVHMIGEKIP